MDFIERLFNISPDNGSGMTEAAMVAALFAIVCLAAGLLHRKRRRTE